MQSQELLKLAAARIVMSKSAAGFLDYLPLILQVAPMLMSGISGLVNRPDAAQEAQRNEMMGAFQGSANPYSPLENNNALNRMRNTFTNTPSVHMNMFRR